MGLAAVLGEEAHAKAQLGLGSMAQQGHKSNHKSNDEGEGNGQANVPGKGIKKYLTRSKFP